MLRLLVATHNAHKAAELRAMLEGQAEVHDLSSLPPAPPPEETGDTFAENARIKALAAAALAPPGLLVLADDSGLEVDGLAGRPGVRSARYAGEHGDDAANRRRVLDELEALERAGRPADRTARFRCVLVLAEARGVLAEFSGSVEGRITRREHGSGGFGYDPIFRPQGHQLTFAEMPPEMKNSLSHRGRALEALCRHLRGEGESR